MSQRAVWGAERRQRRNLGAVLDRINPDVSFLSQLFKQYKGTVQSRQKKSRDDVSVGRAVPGLLRRKVTPVREG